MSLEKKNDAVNENPDKLQVKGESKYEEEFLDDALVNAIMMVLSLQQMLIYEPSKRISAVNSLHHSYFKNVQVPNTSEM